MELAHPGTTGRRERRSKGAAPVQELRQRCRIVLAIRNPRPHLSGASSRPCSTRVLRILLLAFVLFYLAPIAISAVLYLLRGRGVEWWSADRSSVGLLRPASEHVGRVAWT